MKLFRALLRHYLTEPPWPKATNRKELERRLEQARRIADLALDPLTKERLQRLVHELEEQLRLSGTGKR